MSAVVPEGEDPDEIEVKSFDWLERNAGPVDISGAREEETESWQRAREQVDGAAVEIRRDTGAAVVRLPDGDAHGTILVEAAGGDRGPFAGACDCDGWRYHDGPCAHLVTRALRSITRSGEVPVDVERYEELRDAGGLEDDEDADDALADVGGLEDVEDVDDQEQRADGGDQEVDVEASGQTVTGPEAGDQHPPDDVVDVATVDEQEPAAPQTAGDPFAAELAENVPERYVMELGGEPYVRIAGYAAIARQADLRLDYDALTRASEGNHEYAEYEATVRDASGDLIARDMGTAHAEYEDMEDAEAHLDELAITRAYRRAIRLATGGGATLQRGGDA